MNKKLFELDEGTPDGSMKFAYGKAGEAAKNITLDNLKDLIVPTATILKTMVKEIGVWDMNTNAFTLNPIQLYSGSSGFVALPLPVGKIRSVSALIISDNGKTVTDLLADEEGTAPGLQAIDVQYHPLSVFPILTQPYTDVQLSRRNGGTFDTVYYSSNSVNRGWVKIEYVD